MWKMRTAVWVAALARGSATVRMGVGLVDSNCYLAQLML